MVRRLCRIRNRRSDVLKNGKIVQVMGPVVDVEFPDNDLPNIKDALELIIMERNA